MRRHKFARVAAASVLALSTLSGCSVYDSIANYIRADKANICPDAAILASTARLPAFSPSATPDPSAVLYSVSMTNVTSRCDFDKYEQTADTRMRIYFRATRPSGGTEASYRVPYFAAVMNDGNVLDKQPQWLEFEFPAGATTVDAEGVVDSMIVHIAKGKKPYEYHMLVGFQLTKAQIDYDKKMGQYAP